MDNIIDYKLPGDKKSKKKKKPTLRFDLDLPESTDTSCPEYSYVDIVRETLKEQESKGQNDSLCQNMLEEEEEKERNEAKALAEYYEIKYGTIAAGQKHKRKDKGRDLVGAGYGYDDNDPFVDDSEAYDEIVPASLTTQHGGFYINIGKLNFRSVSDDSDTGSTSSDDSVPLSRHVDRKRKVAHMLDTDESEIEFQTTDGVARKKKKKLKSVKDSVTKKRKISLNGKDKVPGLKGSKKIKKPVTLAQKLIAKAKAQQMMNASGVGSPVHPSNGAIPQYRRLSEDKSVAKSKAGEFGHLENKDLAQVAKQLTKELMKVGASKISPEPDRNLMNGSSSATSSTAASKILSGVNHELPPNLPQKLGDKIESLKKIAKSTEARKMKFFSSDVNQILLGIEESAQGLRNKERQEMYQHIAQHLPCSKGTLRKRVKKLQEDDSDQQLKGPVKRLKSAVDAVMTSQIEAYVFECDAKSEKFSSDKTAASTDEDEENEERSLDDSAAGEKAKRKPRRKFRWDDNLRKLLCDVVTVKMNLYERFKLREKQNAEEYLKAFLESAIKPLWPKPWMQTRTLFKESRSAHESLTLHCQKQKKTPDTVQPTQKIQQRCFVTACTSETEAFPKCSISVVKLQPKHHHHHVQQGGIASRPTVSYSKELKNITGHANFPMQTKVRHAPPRSWKAAKKIKAKKQMTVMNIVASNKQHSLQSRQGTLSQSSCKVDLTAERKNKPKSSSGSYMPDMKLPRDAGGNKKVLSVNKDSSKLDALSSQQPVATLQSSAGQNEIAAKISKKQLVSIATDSKTPSLAPGTTPKGNSGVIDLTSGGFELVASIEGEDFDDPMVTTSFSKGAARTTPKDLQNSWKPVSSSKNIATKSTAKLSSPLSGSLSVSSKAGKKAEAKAKPSPGTSSRAHDPFSIEDMRIQDYASDFVKMMMAPGQLPQGTPGYLGMPGITNYETISKILGLKPDDVVPKTSGASSQSDDKFQFKISSNPTISASKLDHSTSKCGLPIPDPGQKWIPQAPDPSSWMRQKSSIQKVLSNKEVANSLNQKTPSSAQNLPATSIPSSFSKGYNLKHPTTPTAPSVSPNFTYPSSNFFTQRQKKFVPPGNSQPTKVAKSGLAASATMQKLVSSAYNSPRHDSSSLTHPLSRRPFHHSGSPSIQSSLHQIDPTVTGLPSMGLCPRSGQYSLAGVGNSFSAVSTSPQGLYSPASNFKTPQSPVHKYPSVTMSVPGHPFDGPSFTNYPQVHLVDVQRNKDSIKQENVNVQGNQSR